MAWTTPNTVAAGGVIRASDYNTYVRDNLNYLLTRTGSGVKRDNGATYTTTSSSFVDIDGTNLAVTMNIAGGKVVVTFCGLCYGNNTINGYFDITVDGTRHGSAGSDGIAGVSGYGANMLVSFSVLVTGLSVGSHTFKVQWKYGAGSTATNLSLYSGNGAGGADVIPCFAVQEVG